MRRRDDGDDDSLPVMVPRSDKGLAAIAPERVRRLREHLIEALGTAKRWEHFASLDARDPLFSRPGWHGRPVLFARAVQQVPGQWRPTAFKVAVIGIE
jgi:hypothetical protein